MRSIALIPLLAFVLLGQTPTAADASVDLRRVDASLTELPFGGDLDAATRWVKQRLERRYAPRIRAALEPNERAKLRAQLDREVFTFRSKLVVFDGHRTGFEVSPIAGEFVVGSNETMARLTEREGDHYFFFINGRLWKYAFAERPQTPFADRVAALARLLGKPDRVENSKPTPGKAAAPLRAIWSDARLRVRLWNRRLVFGYDVLLIEHRPIADGIAELRGGRHPQREVEAVDPDLEGFLLDDGQDEEDELGDEARRP